LPVVTAADFRTSVDRLLSRVAHWEPSRWSQPPTRADSVYALVQRLADLGADAEGRPHRPVPRENDLLLPDQLRVMTDDLLAVAPAPVLRTATSAVDDLRHTL
jgi:hypothetical protein